MAMSAKQRADRLQVVEQVQKIAPGTRLRCRPNGRIYQMGAKHGTTHFWMLCENPPERGIVDARIIHDEFEPVSEVVRG